MEKLFTKYFWIFNLVTLALVAYFLASGSSEIAVSKLEALLPQEPVQSAKATPVPQRVSRAGLTPPRGDDILERNIFDSAMGPIQRGASEETETSDIDPPIVDPNGLPIVPCTDSSITLAATVASQDDTAWSFASVIAGGTTKLYRIGDDLNGRTVSGITWRYLFLRGSADECYVDLFPDPNAPQTANAPPLAEAGSEEKGASQYANQITRKSDTEAEVDRALVNDLLSDPTKFIRSVRVRPNRSAGKTDGYKLRRFRPDSPLALLGAQKGDVIHSVNGIGLTSVDKALGAYQSMRSANDLTFSITRQGKPMELKVSIR